MEIIKAEKSGYCYGITNAISTIDKLLDDGKTDLYILGDISHNKQEMERLYKRGIKKISSPEEIDKGTVFIRTHGISKEEYDRIQKANLDIIDTTCPNVKKVHNLVQKYDELGYQIIIIGDPDHPEVKGIAGWASNKTPIIINDVNKAKLLDDYDKIGIVSQTTFIYDKFKEITEILKNKSRDILIFNTICKATDDRQREAVKVADSVEAMIVVGGYHSSNTQKLKELCSAHCKNTWLIETVQDLDFNKLKGIKKIGLTAGASTPDWLIKEVTDKMEENNVEQAVNIEDVVETVNEVMEAETPEVEVVVADTNEVVPQEEENIFVTSEENAAADEDFDFAAEIDNLQAIHKNSEVKGKVLSVSDDEVLVNINYKSDAVIFKRDFTWKRDEDLRNLVEVGDEITAIVTDLNDGDGRVKLSKIKYDNQQIQDRLTKAYEDREVLYGKVASVSGTKGLMVDVGFYEIFMPASQYHLRYVNDLESLVGNDVRGILIDYNPKRRRAILSQRVLLAEERDQRIQEQKRKKDERFQELQIDDIVNGRIKTITDFGIFVDLNGIDGFIHRSDLTWDRNNDPKKLVQRGNEIEAKVISRNEDDQKIKLSVKALQEKPWEKFVKSYAENDEIEVTITNTLDFGAFAQIIPGVEGLIHISEISYDRVESVNKELKPGDKVKVKIIKIDDDKEKISLSIKATLPRPERPQKTQEEAEYEMEQYGSEGKRERRNRRKNNKRQNNNKNNVFYEESADYTLGETFGNLFEGFDFGEEE